MNTFALMLLPQELFIQSLAHANQNKIRDMSRINFKALFKLVAIVAVVVSLIGANVYFDYKIYKAKYPNTTLWMYILDSK